MLTHKTVTILKRIVAGLLILIVLLFLFSQLFLNSYLERKVRSKLSSIIVTGSDSLYKFTLDKLDISFLTGNLEVENLQVSVDSTRFALLKRSRQLPALTFDLNLTRGSVNGMRIIPFLFSKKIRIGSIVPQNAEINLSRHFYTKQDTQRSSIPLWKAIRNDIRQIKVDKLVLDTVKLFYHNADSARAFNWQFNNCSAAFDDIRIDSIGASDTGRILFTKDIAIVFKNIQLKTADSFYNITSKKIFYSSEKQRLLMDTFSMHPALTSEEFYRKMGRQEDIFTINTEKIDITGFRLERWINNNEVFADSILVQKPDIDIYFDRTLIEIPENRLGKYPPQLLLNAGVSIRVKKLSMNNARVVYRELADSAFKEGKISFTGINASIVNITNHPVDIKKNPLCSAEFSCVFMESSPMRAWFEFHLNTTDGGFGVKGNLRNLKASQLDPVTMALSKTQLSSLQMHELVFDVAGNEQRATGNLQMKYNDLNVVFNKQDNGGDVKKNKFLTKLINRFVLRPHNPMPGEPERKAQNILSVRDPHKSFFSIVWRTINACIQYITLNIIGLTS